MLLDNRVVKTLLCSSPCFDCRLKGWVGAQVVMLALEVNECVPSVVLFIVPHSGVTRGVVAPQSLRNYDVADGGAGNQILSVFDGVRPSLFVQASAAKDLPGFQRVDGLVRSITALA